MLLKSCQSTIVCLKLKFDLSVQEAGCSSSKTADPWGKNLKMYQIIILKSGIFKTTFNRPAENWIAEQLMSEIYKTWSLKELPTETQPTSKNE